MRKLQSKTLLSQHWLLTFADIIMLLMVFFVMILSMSKIDSSLLSKVYTSTTRNFSPSLKKGETKADGTSKEISVLLLNSQQRHLQKKHILELIFAGSKLPKNLKQEDIAKNVDIVTNAQGFSFSLATDLVFQKKSVLLSTQGKMLLDLLTPVIQSIEGDIEICAMGSAGANKNMQRSYAILTYLYNKGIEQSRISLSVIGKKSFSRIEIVLITK